jgi:hypothetical protein
MAVAFSRAVDSRAEISSAGWQVEPYWQQAEQRLMRDDLPRVDCILSTTGCERKAIADANSAQIEGREISVLSAEDLIVFKLIAERARAYEAVAPSSRADGK